MFVKKLIINPAETKVSKWLCWINELFRYRTTSLQAPVATCEISYLAQHSKFPNSTFGLIIELNQIKAISYFSFLNTK
jgi:ABC-type uncharacterized transport system fused permease/ATPase subunit